MAEKSGWVLIRTILGALGVLAALSCQARAETLGFSVSPGNSNGGLVVQVADDATLAPLPDARIQISDELGPGRKMVTVSKPGYAITTVVGVSGHSLTVYLKPLIAPAERENIVVSGTMGDYQVPADSSKVRAGVVFSALSAFDLLHFQFDSVVSPLNDTIDVWGPRQIPSNIVLPRQNISVLFLTVTLDKRPYRLPLAFDRVIRLVGAQGEMSTGDIMSVVTGGGVTPSLLNKLNFTRIGVTEPFLPSSSPKDVPATIDLTPGHQVSVTEPPFSADVIVAAVDDLNGDRETLVPTDLKYAESSETDRFKSPISLKVPAQTMARAEGVVGIALGNKGKELSGIITEPAGAHVATGSFLNVAALSDFPALPAHVNLQAEPHTISIAIFESAPASAAITGRSVRAQPVWYVYSLPSAGAVSFPTNIVALPENPNAYSVMSLEFGTEFDERNLDGTTVLRDLRRFTRAGASKTARDPRSY